MSRSIPSLLSEARCLWNANALLGEGAVWSSRTGSVYWVDILGRKLHRYRLADREQRTWTFQEEISSLAERRGGAGLAITLRSAYALFDPDTGSLQRLHAPEPDRPANRFNDGKCDRAGRYWAGTMDFAGAQPTGALYRLDANGQCTRQVDGIAIVNGPTWSRDERVLYVASTSTREVFAFDFDAASGELGDRRVWLKLAEEDGYPDGMTTDAADRVWLAHWGAGCVTCHAPSGEELLRVRVPARFTTSCAFGGTSLNTLFITTACGELTEAQRKSEPLAGSLFCVETDAVGQAPNLFAG